MVEPDGQYPLSGHVLDTAMTGAGAQVLVQVGDRLGQPGMMRPSTAQPVAGPPRPYRIESLLVGRSTTRRRGRRCGHAGGQEVRRCRGGGPRTSAGSPPAMLRPPAQGW